MKPKTIIIAVFSILVVIGFWLAFREMGPEFGGSDITNTDSAKNQNNKTEIIEAASKSSDHNSAASRSAAGPESSTTRASESHEFGTLRITMLWSDRTPAAGVGFCWSSTKRGAADFIAAPYAMTDAAGVYVIDRSPAGNISIHLDRGLLKTAMVRGGVDNDIEILIDLGIGVDGIVVDGQGAPVANATIYLLQFSTRRDWPVTKTDARGKFTIRSIADFDTWVFAKVDGKIPSLAKNVSAGEGAVVKLILTIKEPAGVLSGIVLNPNREPVAGAVIWVGNREMAGSRDPDGSISYEAPLPRETTGADGKFTVLTVPIGKQTIRVRAPDLAYWTGEIMISSGAPANIEINLSRGASLVGTVRDAAGDPPQKTLIQVNQYGDPDYYSTIAYGGNYQIKGLPAGTLHIRADAEDRGSASTSLTAVSGAEVRWDIQLSAGLTLNGRVVDEANNPIPNCRIDVAREDYDPNEHGGVAVGFTGPDGTFSIPQCPNAALSLSVTLKENEAAELAKVDNVRAGGEEIVITIKSGIPKLVRIIGAFADASGTLLSSGEVDVENLLTGFSNIKYVDPATGKFEAASLLPGEYVVSFRSPGIGIWSSKARAIEPGGVWDLGIVKVQKPGSLTVVPHLDGNVKIPQFVFFILTPETLHKSTVRMKDGIPQPEPLAPGDYELLVNSYSSKIASKIYLFTIRSGEETVLDVDLRAGIARHLKFRMPEIATKGAEKRDSLLLIIRNSAGIMVYQRRHPLREGIFDAFVALDAGEYQYEAKTDSRASASGKFRVDAEGAAMIAIELK
ncbi:MAG: hypothetical protein ACKVS6_05135 [Planctomycetota bacterium]